MNFATVSTDETTGRVRKMKLALLKRVWGMSNRLKRPLIFRATLLTLFLAIPIGWGWERSDGLAELSQHELTLQYAKTKLELAEIDLQNALTMGEANAIPGLTVERVRSSLAVAKEQYHQAQLASNSGAQRVRLRHAEERLRLADVQLAAGRRLNKSGTISDLELRRLQLKSDLAKLHLTLLQRPGNAASQMQYMQDQIDRFGEEMLLLEQRMARLESRR